MSQEHKSMRLQDERFYFARDQLSERAIMLLSCDIEWHGGKVVTDLQQEADVVIVNPCAPAYKEVREECESLLRDVDVVLPYISYHQIYRVRNHHTRLSSSQDQLPIPRFVHPDTKDPLKIYVSLNVEAASDADVDEDGKIDADKIQFDLQELLKEHGAIIEIKRALCDVGIFNLDVNLIKSQKFIKELRDAGKVVFGRQWVERCIETGYLEWPRSAGGGARQVEEDAEPDMPAKPQRHLRTAFTAEEDDNLCRWLAHYYPRGHWFSRKTFEILCDNVKRYPWAGNHPPQSWHQRFRTNSAAFSTRVENYVKKGIDETLTLDGQQPKASRYMANFKRARSSDAEEEPRKAKKANTASTSNGVHAKATTPASPVVSKQAEAGSEPSPVARKQAEAGPGPSTVAAAAAERHREQVEEDDGLDPVLAPEDQQSEQGSGDDFPDPLAVADAAADADVETRQAAAAAKTVSAPEEYDSDGHRQLEVPDKQSTPVPEHRDLDTSLDLDDAETDAALFASPAQPQALAADVVLGPKIPSPDRQVLQASPIFEQHAQPQHITVAVQQQSPNSHVRLSVSTHGDTTVDIDVVGTPKRRTYIPREEGYVRHPGSARKVLGASIEEIHSSGGSRRRSSIKSRPRSSLNPNATAVTPDVVLRSTKTPARTTPPSPVVRLARPAQPAPPTGTIAEGERVAQQLREKYKTWVNSMMLQHGVTANQVVQAGDKLRAEKEAGSGTVRWSEIEQELARVAREMR